MKHIIEFDLSGEDQIEESKRLKRCINSLDMEIAIWDILQEFRNEMKYNEDLSARDIELLDNMRSKMLQIIEDKDLGYILD